MKINKKNMICVLSRSFFRKICFFQLLFAKQCLNNVTVYLNTLRETKFFEKIIPTTRYGSLVHKRGRFISKNSREIGNAKTRSDVARACQTKTAAPPCRAAPLKAAVERTELPGSEKHCREERTSREERARNRGDECKLL